MSGVLARPPTLRKIRGAVSVSSPTAMVRSPVKRACPRISVQPLMPAIQSSRPLRELADTLSARAFTRAMSTRTGASTMTP